MGFLLDFVHNLSSTDDIVYFLVSACVVNFHDLPTLLQTSVVHTLLFTDLNWKCETWLMKRIHQSGINPKLLTEYFTDVPMSLLGHPQLYLDILEVQNNPLNLTRIARKSIRKCLATQLQRKVKLLEIPARLKDFVMLRIL